MTENPPRAMMATRGTTEAQTTLARNARLRARPRWPELACQPAGRPYLGQPGSENPGEGGVVSKHVLLEDHSVRRSVERGGRIHDQRGQARCAQPTLELHGVAATCSSAHSVAWAYADRDGVVAVGTELQGGRHGGNAGALAVCGGCGRMGLSSICRQAGAFGVWTRNYYYAFLIPITVRHRRDRFCV